MRRSKNRDTGEDTVVRDCKGCGQQFFLSASKARKNRRYCSKSCRKNICSRECEQCGMKFNTAKKSGRRVCGTKCPALRVEYTCTVCSVVASRPRCFGMGKFCSNQCYHLWLKDNSITIDPMNGMRRPIKGLSKRDRKIRGGDLINSYDVFEFYGWICIVCDKDIDPDLAWPDKGSATLDHIVPLSRGGTHTWDNVAPSHLLCNSKKDDSFLTDVVERHREFWDGVY